MMLVEMETNKSFYFSLYGNISFLIGNINKLFTKYLRKHRKQLVELKIMTTRLNIFINEILDVFFEFTGINMNTFKYLCYRY